LAHSSSSRLEAAPAAAVSLFEDVNELLAPRPSRPPALGSESLDDSQRAFRAPPADPRWLQPAEQVAVATTTANLSALSRTRFFVQGGLFCVVASLAFAAGYFFGQGRNPPPAAVTTKPAMQHAVSAAKAATPSAEWPTPQR
jgi:hypothetical protein